MASDDPLGALKRVGLREDPPALAFRGIAMAQLDDLVRAKSALKKAARVFGPREAVARARCIVAEAELALVSRDPGWPAQVLNEARATLEAHGDRLNTAHAHNIEARRLLLIGYLEEAELVRGEVDPGPLPPLLTAARELVIAGIAMRRLEMKPARDALRRPGFREASQRRWRESRSPVACCASPRGTVERWRAMHHYAHVAADILTPLELGAETPRDGLGQEPARSADIPERVEAGRAGSCDAQRVRPHHSSQLFSGSLSFFGHF